MSPATLIRWSGLVSIAAALLINVAEVVGRAVGLMQMEQMAVTPLTAAWVPLNLLQLFGFVLMLLALVGLYARQAEVTGVLGLVGFLAAFLGTSLMTGASWTNTFTPPVIAREAPALLMIHPPPPPLGPAFLATTEMFAVGLILFGIATLLAHELPRGGAVLLIIGGALVRILPALMVPVPLDALLIGLGLIWLGYALWSGTGEPSRRSTGGGLDTALLKRLMTFRSVPPHIILLTALASYAGQIIAALQAWPLWAIVLATLIPWIPLFTLEMVWTYRHYHWLALFYVLVVTQGGHFLEHVVQVTQIHLLGLRGVDARGIFGALDIEWVHFIWNTWVVIAVVLLLRRFRRNPWLWAALPVVVWHEIEHLSIMAVYLVTGQGGLPGLLSAGGAIGGGLPLARPDLHFFYNLIETVPLVFAFIYQLKHTYDEWLAKALPHLSEPLLAATTNELETLRFRSGDTVVRQGDPADRFYIITQGLVTVTRQDQDGQGVELATLGPGQFFGEIGLLTHTPRTASVCAKTDVEVLALDRESFRRVTESSEATAEDLAQVARERLAAASA